MITFATIARVLALGYVLKASCVTRKGEFLYEATATPREDIDLRGLSVRRIVVTGTSLEYVVTRIVRLLGVLKDETL